MPRLIAVLGVLCCLIAGCSGIRPYDSDLRNNLIISTQTDLGFLSGVDASLDIYRMADDCDVQYQGTVDLSSSRVEIGVPTDQPAYLVFNFENSAFLTSSRSHMSYDVVLSPVTGYVYDVSVSYRDDIYNVEVQERLPGMTGGQQLVVGMHDTRCGTRS